MIQVGIVEIYTNIDHNKQIVLHVNHNTIIKISINL